MRLWAVLCGLAVSCGDGGGDGDDGGGTGDCDESDEIMVFTDADGDGYGAGQSVAACAVGDGQSEVGGDCDDGAPRVHPGAAEICGPQQYAAAGESTNMLREGRNDDLIETLRDRMREAADAERYEEAGQLRDAMRTVQTLRDRQQKVATAGLVEKGLAFQQQTGKERVLRMAANDGHRALHHVFVSGDLGDAQRAQIEIPLPRVEAFFCIGRAAKPDQFGRGVRLPVTQALSRRRELRCAFPEGDATTLRGGGLHDVDDRPTAVQERTKVLEINLICRTAAARGCPIRGIPEGMPIVQGR